MPTLWEISDDLLKLNDVIAEREGEISDDDHEIETELDAWFESVHSDLSLKLDNYCALIRELEAKAAVRKAASLEVYTEYMALQGLENRSRSRIKRLKNRLISFFRLHKITHYETKRFAPRIVANGGALPLYFEAVEVPDEFMTKIPDTRKIREALERGEKLSFARLGERGDHLRLR